KMIANWNTFNIGQNASVAFQQPGASSVALNRILDQNPSQIFGSLSANGQVFLLNPAGVYFGPTAQVDVGGLVASSLNLSNENFLAGKYHFENNGIAGAVSNQGQIRTADGGYVAFLSPKITNEGAISTPGGMTALAAGDKVSLDFTGDKLVMFTIDQGTIDAQIENKGLIQAQGGLVKMTARAVDELTQAVVNNSGIVEAKGIVNKNGRIILDADQVIQSGSLDASADGAAAGSINIAATGMAMNTGSLKATGNQGGEISVSGQAIVEAGVLDVSAITEGGKISLAATESLEQTAASALKADAAQGRAGTIRVESQGGTYLSGAYSASGETGGNISLTGSDLILAGASVSADGAQGGGLLRIGGGWQGKDTDIANAKNTTLMNVTLAANARQKGDGGTVVVWSDESTSYNGKIEAQGGAAGGDGGRVEISSKGSLGFGGKVDVQAPQGQNGSLLLDPKDIEIVTLDSGLSFIPLTYASPQTGDQHGSGAVVELKNGGVSTGNVVVASPYDKTAATSAGAVRLYRMSDGSLLSTLTGAKANDQVGSGGVTALTNGNYVVNSPLWDNGATADAGAVTWGNGTTGINGTVAIGNSLAGSNASDQVGSGGVTALTNGNYVVSSKFWNNGETPDAGAVTWGSGTAGVKGAVSAANSLVGSSKNDQVGSGGVTALTNGNYVVASPVRDIGEQPDAGAVTWGDGTKGVKGAISAANSLVGKYYSSAVGSGGVSALPNGNYVVVSPSCEYGKGAVTWGNGTTGIIGQVSKDNSLMGSMFYDYVGVGGVTVLTNGNYVVVSTMWHNGETGWAGAVTWGSGTVGVKGYVSAANSLVGSSKDDGIGSGGITALTNGNYVVASPIWNNGAVADAGAVTWGSGTAGVKGAVSAANSLVGSTKSDRIGSGGITGITALTNGNYVVASPIWDNGATADAGAVTWGSGTAGVKGAVSDGNSLVGSTANDKVGSGGIKALTNGNYVVASPVWDNGATADAGAVTWSSGTTGISGAVTADNSLVGSTATDQVGSGGITALTNGNYVVISPFWNGAMTDAGAVTWGSGTTGISGAVSADNSLVGSKANDKVGSGGITALTNGNYVVASPGWDNGATADTGAVTWSSGTTGISGAVSAANSLVGSKASDKVGSGGITVLTNDNYLVVSPLWDKGLSSDAGAVTLADGTTGITGEVTFINSLRGSYTNDRIGEGGVTIFSDGTAAVRSPKYKSNTGRVDIVKGFYVAPDSIDFNDNPGARSRIDPSEISKLLSGGTAVTLQANNDITLKSALTVNNAGGDGANLTLQAGRSILLNDSITTDNGNLTLTANETTANGVVDANRDAGAAVITMASGQTINAGTGTVTITLANGAGKTNKDSGDITLQGITAGSLSVNNQGLTAGSNISLGATTLSGNLTLGSASGNITQSGVLSVGGTTAITAGVDAVSFDTASNNFIGPVSIISGKNVSLLDTVDNLTLGDINVSGDLNAEAKGGDLLLSGDIVKASGTDATATLKATGNITLADTKKIESASGKLNTILWSDTDANGGGILLNNNSTITTNGGHLWMGGGSGTTDWNGLTVGDGYALGKDFGIGGSDNYTGVLLGTTDASGISLQTNGGDIALYGQASTELVAGYKIGIHTLTGATINSGTGKISLDGKNTNTYNAGSGWKNSIEIVGTTITSANAASDAISINGDSSTADAKNDQGIYAVQISGNTVISATAGGGVSLTGKTNAASSVTDKVDIYLKDASILANSGPITITGLTSQGIKFDGNAYAGYKSGSAIEASSSNIAIMADKLTLAGTDRIQSSGALTVKPYSATTIGIAGGAGTLSLPASYFADNFTNGFSGITIGSASAGNITIGNNALTYNDPLTLKTAGNITAGSSSLTGAVDQNASLVLWADADANGTGSISLSSSSITTNNAHLWMGGGSGSTTWNGLAVGNGAAGGNQAIYAINSTLNTGSGDSYLYGRSTGTDNTNGLGIGVYLDNNTLLSGKNITITGEGSLYNTGGRNFGVNIQGNPTDAKVTASGDITITGTGGGKSDSGVRSHGVLIRNSTGGKAVEATGSGNITITGYGGPQGADNGHGIILGEGASTDYWHSGIIQSAGGNITLKGNIGNGASSTGIVFGTDAATQSKLISTGGGAITLEANSISFGGTGVRLTSSGALTVRPQTPGTSIGLAGASGSLSLPAAFFSTMVTDGFTGITVGSADAGKITAGAFTANDHLTLMSGAGGMELTGALDAGANTLTLNSTGSVTESGAGSITAGVLNLLGTGGKFTLGSETNNAVTLQANTGSVAYLDIDGLTLGGEDSGIEATGEIDIATKSGDLTVSQNITTTNASAAAVMLNAGKDTAAGTAAGGNIIISGGGVTVGAGGRATLYTGSLAGSTGLAESSSGAADGLITYGSGHFRYASDEATTSYTEAPTAGKYAIYREKVAFTISPQAKTITYGDALSFTEEITGSYKNGDTQAEDRTGTPLWAVSGDLSLSKLPKADKAHTATYASGYASKYGYSYEAGAGAALTVNKKNLTMTANDNGKVITDVDPTLTAKYEGFVNGETSAVLDSISVTRAAGEGKGTYVITPSANSTEGNYSLNFVNGTFDVYAAETLLIRVAGDSKIYGSTVPTFTATEAKYVTAGNELKTLTLTSTGANSYDYDDGLGTTGSFKLTSPAGNLSNVGNYDITVTDFTQTGANFSTQKTQTGNLVINPYVVSLTGSRSYDGTANVAAGKFTMNPLVNSQTLTLSGSGTVASRNVGSSLAVTIGTLALGNDTGLASNYTLSGGTHQATITRADLTISTPNVTKIYDGNTTAAGTATATAGTVFAGDSLSGGTFTFDNKNVGAGNKTVTVSGVTVNDGNAGGNYNVTYASNTTSTITPKTVIAGGITASHRTYDGTTNATVSAAGATLTGKVEGDDLSINTVTGAFANKHVGNAKTVALATTYVGADKDNYTLVDQAAATANIYKADLTLSTPNITKIYDGNTTAAGTASATSGTVFAGDSLSGGTFTFDNKNAGAGNKTVTVSGVTLTDGNAGGNYNVTYASNTTSTINPYAVSLTGTRVYDGTANAAAGIFTMGALVGNETLTLSGTGTMADKHVGTGKAVTIGTLSLGDGTNGGLASNYTFTGGTQTSDITKADLMISTSNVIKTYDGTTTAAGTATVTAGTLFGADSISGGTFAFTDKNAGIGDRTVTVSAVTLSDGNGGGNYAVTYADNTTSTINPKAVTIAPTASKIYDATIDASSAITWNISGLVGDETLSVSTASAAYDTKIVETNKTVTMTGIALGNGSGANAGVAANYSLAEDSATIHTGVITKKDLSFKGVEAENKVYDATNTAVVDFNEAVIEGVIEGDAVNIDKSAATAAFADKNVGFDKTVSVSNLIITGADSGNYSAGGTLEVTAVISPKSLTASYTAQNKVYDTTTTATVNGSSSDIIAGDTVTFTQTANFTDKDAATAKTVNISGIALSGADGGNYILQDTTAAATADITPKPITATGVTASGKVYDANTTATINTASAVITGGASADDDNKYYAEDTVVLEKGAATGAFDDKNVA
ncbi:MAG TPA: YDG domain-containing protein, partial [Myxococcota bacterium]|nr:YDG domain-containing protein [Myxococcota bacterium]